MKHSAFICSALVLLSLGSCRRTEKEKVSSDAPADSTATALPVLFYGHLGEGTGMSSLELITDTGDTLALSKTNEEDGSYGLILGCITNYTDRYVVETDDSCTCVKRAVNLSQLAVTWTAARASGYTLTLNADGHVSATGDECPTYSSWTLDNGRLLFHSSIHVEEPRMVATATDTAELLALCTDSMTLAFRGKEPVTFYHLIKKE